MMAQFFMRKKMEIDLLRAGGHIDNHSRSIVTGSTMSVCVAFTARPSIALAE